MKKTLNNMWTTVRRNPSFFLMFVFVFGLFPLVLSSKTWEVAEAGTTNAQAAIPAEKLKLHDAQKVERGFDEIASKSRAICFIFFYPECPLCKKYTPVLAKLIKEFEQQGIHFVGVVGEQVGAHKLEKHHINFTVPFPIYTDTGFLLANALSAKTTPEVFLMDRERKILYSGRIDDRFQQSSNQTNPGIVKSAEKQRDDLREAIMDVLSGKAVRVPKTIAPGCPLSRPELPKENRPSIAKPGDLKEDIKVTYYKDVLPILNRHCQACHSPGNAGPFNLVNYEDAVDWIEMGLNEIDAQRMPPAQIESDLEYTAAKPPNANEISKLRRWLANNKPKGDPASQPKLEPLQDSKAFRTDIGPPDIIITQSAPSILGADGNDVYRNIVFPYNSKITSRIRAIQYLPGNNAIVHHALFGYLPSTTARQAEKEFGGTEGYSHPDDKMPGFWSDMKIGFKIPKPRADGLLPAAFLGAYIPGSGQGILTPPDVDMLVPPETDFVVQIHYHRTGKRETSTSRIGIWLDKDPVEIIKKKSNFIYIYGDFMAIPAGAKDFRIKGNYTLPEEANLMAVGPHAHFLCKWISLTAYVPGQKRPINIIKQPNWNFDWQASYFLKEPMHFPKGTRFETEAAYDNSSGNPKNPNNPPQTVYNGESTLDEMLLPMLSFSSNSFIDPENATYSNFTASLNASFVLRRFAEHNYKYVWKTDGTIVESPDYLVHGKPRTPGSAAKAIKPSGNPSTSSK